MRDAWVCPALGSESGLLPLLPLLPLLLLLPLSLARTA
jgi:hypothetical protein